MDVLCDRQQLIISSENREDWTFSLRRTRPHFSHSLIVFCRLFYVWFRAQTVTEWRQRLSVRWASRIRDRVENFKVTTANTISLVILSVYHSSIPGSIENDWETRHAWIKTCRLSKVYSSIHNTQVLEIRSCYSPTGRLEWECTLKFNK